MEIFQNAPFYEEINHPVMRLIEMSQCLTTVS